MEVPHPLARQDTDHLSPLSICFNFEPQTQNLHVPPHRSTSRNHDERHHIYTPASKLHIHRVPSFLIGFTPHIPTNRRFRLQVSSTTTPRPTPEDFCAHANQGTPSVPSGFISATLQHLTAF